MVSPSRDCRAGLCVVVDGLCMEAGMRSWGWESADRAVSAEGTSSRSSRDPRYDAISKPPSSSWVSYNTSLGRERGMRPAKSYLVAHCESAVIGGGSPEPHDDAEIDEVDNVEEAIEHPPLPLPVAGREIWVVHSFVESPGWIVRKHSARHAGLVARKLTFAKPHTPQGQ